MRRTANNTSRLVDNQAMPRDRETASAYDADGNERNATMNIADRVRAGRLRKSLVLANICAWLLIAIAIKWLLS